MNKVDKTGREHDDETVKGYDGLVIMTNPTGTQKLNQKLSLHQKKGRAHIKVGLNMARA